MTITYDDIKHKLQPPLDCSEIKDLRGQGCVLYHCYPSGFANALEVNPAQSEEDMTLKGVNLQEANLVAANLQGANLQGADLQEADLEKANLQGVNLQAADLQGANFQHSKLKGADLELANLQGTTLFWGANLQGAYLQYAKLREALYNSKTNFEDSNITKGQIDSMIFVEDED
jgi:uncharacterized protein YjbI with pentapeptide repeats